MSNHILILYKKHTKQNEKNTENTGKRLENNNLRVILTNRSNNIHLTSNTSEVTECQ